MGDEDNRTIINEYFEIFINQIESNLLDLPQQAIHCDSNDYNLMVRPSLDGPSFAGLIDFGDMVLAPVVCDVAAMTAYMVLDKPRPLQALTALCAAMPAVIPVGARDRHDLSADDGAAWRVAGE